MEVTQVTVKLDQLLMTLQGPLIWQKTLSFLDKLTGDYLYVQLVVRCVIVYACTFIYYLFINALQHKC